MSSHQFHIRPVVKDELYSSVNRPTSEGTQEESTQFILINVPKTKNHFQISSPEAGTIETPSPKPFIQPSASIRLFGNRGNAVILLLSISMVCITIMTVWIAINTIQNKPSFQALGHTYHPFSTSVIDSSITDSSHIRERIYDVDLLNNAVSKNDRTNTIQEAKPNPVTSDSLLTIHFVDELSFDLKCGASLNRKRNLKGSFRVKRLPNQACTLILRPSGHRIFLPADMNRYQCKTELGGDSIECNSRA